MGANATKLKCLYLPAQSGKTRKVEKLIEYYKEIHECFGDGDINIIISANNRLLVEQTKTRMVTDLATPSEEGADDATIKAGVFSWTSGTKASNISPEGLAFRLLGEIEMVVMCVHSMRMKYLDQTLERLAACPLFTKKINIWIDEADKSINIWQNYERVMSLPAVNQVTLVSATFDSVFKKYKNLQVMGFYKTHPDCYRCLKDSVDITDDYASENAYDYVHHVMLKNRTELARPGMRAFIPGEITKESHNLIADFLHKELNFVVIIINGHRKEILIPGGGVIDLHRYLTMGSSGEMPEEFNSQLAKLYKDNEWKRFPMAITGFLCVQRGVTFQCGPKEGVHDGFVFDYGVIPPIVNKADAYQAMARLFGNVGDFSTYKPVRIYTTSRMIEIVRKQEAVAVNLARMVKEQSIEVVGKDYIKMVSNYNTNVEVREFDTIEDLRRKWSEISESNKKARCPNKNDENQYVCAIGEKSSKQKADDVRKFITGNAAGWGSGLTDAQAAKKRGEKVGPIHRVYVGYTDEDKPKFFLRWMNV
jgi:hypothetical protein